MTIFRIQEHNEAFYILSNISKKYNSKIDLIHIDSHTDLDAFLLEKKFDKNIKSFSDQEKLNLTNWDVTISSYITACIKFRLLNNIIYLGHQLKPRISFVSANTYQISQKLLGIEINNEKPDKNPMTLYYSVTYNDRIIELITKPLVISIDLDFFYTDNVKGNQIKIQISDEEARKISNGKNPVRLKFGQAVRVIKEGQRFFVYLNFLDQFRDLSTKLPETIIKSNFRKLKIFLKTNITKKPEAIILCKSVKSGYLPYQQQELVNKYTDEIVDFLNYLF
ncbi:hypothetical protein [Oenococcus oeni]|uniref:hypothetical protein n=1 Tax=Oenococcus oeni TaxID=1247 RepID=UPI0010B6C4FD|nr:hypothetical protein [Oenococcus oeni]SYW14945.1 hypothetical protein OENI_80015 [Oenococcus oeni]